MIAAIAGCEVIKKRQNAANGNTTRLGPDFRRIISPSSPAPASRNVDGSGTAEARTFTRSEYETGPALVDNVAVVVKTPGERPVASN
jgi:hypothetical protein